MVVKNKIKIDVQGFLNKFIFFILYEKILIALMPVGCHTPASIF
jgi:hypothetical protein